MSKTITYLTVFASLFIPFLFTNVFAESSYCKLAEVETRKVLFGKPMQYSYPPATKDDMAGVMDALIHAFEWERERQWVMRNDDSIAFKKCEEKGLDSKDEWRSRAKKIYRYRVVLDMRSLLTTKSKSGKIEQEIIVQYASIPTLYLRKQDQGAPGGLYNTKFSIKQGDSFVEIFSQPLEIDAFVSAGLGLCYLDERFYDDALSNLCKAKELFETLASRAEGHLKGQKDLSQGQADLLHRQIKEILSIKYSGEFGKKYGTFC